MKFPHIEHNHLVALSRVVGQHVAVVWIEHGLAHTGHLLRVQRLGQVASLKNIETILVSNQQEVVRVKFKTENLALSNLKVLLLNFKLIIYNVEIRLGVNYIEQFFLLNN